MAGEQNFHEALEMQFNLLKFVDHPQLKLENRIGLQGYLNCARDLGVITIEEFEVHRDRADAEFDLKKYYIDRMQQIVVEMMENL